MFDQKANIKNVVRDTGFRNMGILPTGNEPMPVIVKVNVSRKLTKDFQSQGFGLEIQGELPNPAIDDPEAMAQATDHLFAMAGDLLAEQVRKAEGDQGTNEPAALPRAGANPPVAGHGGFVRGGARGRSNGTYRNARGQTNGNGDSRGITDAQAKAIENIARRLEQDADRLAQDEFGKNVKELSLREASGLIDNLKKEIEGAKPVGTTR